MKKFKEEDILFNSIVARPRVSFFASNGVVYFDRKGYRESSSRTGIDSVGLFELLNKLAPPNSILSEIPDGAVLTEAGDSLTTESGDNLLIE